MATAGSDSEKANVIRSILRTMVVKGQLKRGDYTRIADLYHVSRERVRQLGDEVKGEGTGLSRTGAARFGPKAGA